MTPDPTGSGPCLMLVFWGSFPFSWDLDLLGNRKGNQADGERKIQALLLIKLGWRQGLELPNTSLPPLLPPTPDLNSRLSSL